MKKTNNITSVNLSLRKVTALLCEFKIVIEQLYIQINLA